MKLAVHIVLVLHICLYYDTVRIYSLLMDNWKKDSKIDVNIRKKNIFVRIHRSLRVSVIAKNKYLNH